jgi:hypothetical protein
VDAVADATACIARSASFTFSVTEWQERRIEGNVKIRPGMNAKEQACSQIAPYNGGDCLAA